MNRLWLYNTTEELQYGIEVQLQKRFTFHAPDDTKMQVPRYEAIRQKAYEFGELLYHLTPTSREQSLALTQLEDAVMWANAAIARNE